MRRRTRRRILGVLGFLVLAGIVAGAWVWFRTGMAPEWYAPADPTSVVVASTAERVEYGMVQEFHRIRPAAETWRSRVTEDEINAWFAARMPEWIAHEQQLQWPEALGAPQVKIGPEAIELALEVGDGAGARVLVARVVPALVEGRLTLDVERVGLGQLLLGGPTAGRILDVLEGALPSDVVGEDLAPILVGVLSGQESVGSDFGLSDGRRVEIVALTLGDGAIEFESRTFPPEP